VSTGACQIAEQTSDPIGFDDEEPDGFEDTAAHWVNVYEELQNFVRVALADGATEPARSALEQRARRFEERFAFWTAELERVRGQEGRR